MIDKTEIKKQFIAGARCPSCGAIDCLTFYRLDNKPIRECVDCDFKEVLGEKVDKSDQKQKGQKKSAQMINIKELN